jgi:L-alanine-DL-glutamate epimerase-like enolase superfamily enzyme
LNPSLLIEHIRVAPIDIPLADSFVISQGEIQTAHNAFVAVTLRDGTLGYGEVAPFPALTGETREACIEAVNAARDDLLGISVLEYRNLSERITAATVGVPAARAALECAIMDAYARAFRVPMWALWGAQQVRPLTTDITLPILAEDRVDELALHWYEQGFRVFKMKVGDDLDADVARVTRLAKSYSDVNFILDANQGFDLDGARKFDRELRHVSTRILMFEQPVHRDDIDGMAALRAESSVPITADESVFTIEDAERIIRREAADIINLKVTKSGLLSTLDIARLARSSGIDLMIGGMVETRLAMSMSLSIAMGFGGFRALDLDTPLLMSTDPVVGGYRYDGATMSTWSEPGLGVTPRDLTELQ